ncbi:YtxH domain-containing protein [Candidatus Saccharibacteria bacterium]|nr:YtxH domain-containing protein [Candidatus Saccharibacteria bacterium]
MAKNSGKWAAGALAAGVVGYVAGVLTAPKSGKETRKDIKTVAYKAKMEAEKKLKLVHSELSDKLADAKKTGANLQGKAKTEYNDIMIKAGVAREKVRDVLSTLHDGDAGDPELKKAFKDAKDALKHLEKFVKKR